MPNPNLGRLSETFSHLADELHVPYIAVLPALIANEEYKPEVKENNGAHPRNTGYFLERNPGVGAEVKFGESEAVFMQGQSAEPQDPVSSVGSEPGQTIIAAPKAEMVLRYLAVTDGPSKGTTAQLKAGATSIGRDQGNDIQISDASVSREHAVIISSSKESKIVDLGSSTGTTVNGESVGGGSPARARTARLAHV